MDDIILDTRCAFVDYDGDITVNQRPPMDDSNKEPFSKQEMLVELNELLYKQVALIYVAAGLGRVATLAGRVETEDTAPNTLGWPETTAIEFGFDSSQWPITEYFGNLYEFGVLAVARVSPDTMGDETEYTYCANWVKDLSESRALEEFFSANGNEVVAEKCLLVARMASARLALEGFERFANLDHPKGYYLEDLSLREVALLARMEEASVRNAANPNRPNPLKTYSEGGRTYVSPKDAKEWLKARGRYVPIRYELAEHDIDLALEGFKYPGDLWHFIEKRSKASGKPLESLAKTLDLPSLSPDAWGTIALLDAEPEQRERIGKEIGVPPKLLSLRMEELRLRIQAKVVQEEIERITIGLQATREEAK